MLTLAGEPPLGWMESLGENAAQMAPSGRLLLASAYAASGDKKTALSLIGKPSANLGQTPANNENLDSTLRDEAAESCSRAHTPAPTGGETAAAASSLIAKNQLRRARYDAGGRLRDGGALALVRGQPAQGNARWRALLPPASTAGVDAKRRDHNVRPRR